jgi:hypothetical protein
MVLTYPDLAADVLAGKPLQRKRICRTFSDCTTAPRNGLISGCYPLDEYYKKRPEAKILTGIKQLRKDIREWCYPAVIAKLFHNFAASRTPSNTRFTSSNEL